MKKTDFVLIALVLVVILIGIFSTKGSSAIEYEFPLKLAGEVGLNEITYQDYKDMVDAEDAFIVIIERTGCSYCQMYMPIVEEVAKEKNIAITYINTDNVSAEDIEELSTTNSYLKKNQWGTPTTLFMLGNKVIDSISGYVEKETFESFLKDRVIIEGE